jgi:hypothetical protein
VKCDRNLCCLVEEVPFRNTREGLDSRCFKTGALTATPQTAKFTTLRCIPQWASAVIIWILCLLVNSLCRSMPSSPAAVAYKPPFRTDLILASVAWQAARGLSVPGRLTDIHAVFYRINSDMKLRVHEAHGEEELTLFRLGTGL